MLSQNAQGKCTAHMGNCLLYSLNDVSFVFTGNQVGNNLCIRLRSKVASASNQLFLEIQVVFDNPVVYNREFLAVICVRMGVLVRRLTMSSPARVPDSCTTGQRSGFKSGLQISHTALCLNNL
ncbi:hypothetical protein D3C75_692090 [compost metagenome]